MTPTGCHHLRRTPWGGWFLLTVAFVLLALPAPEARGHVTSTALSRVQVEGATVTYTLEVEPGLVALAVGLIESKGDPVSQRMLRIGLGKISRYLSARLVISGDGRQCLPGPVSLMERKFPEAVSFRIAFDCKTGFQKLLIQYLLFFEADSHHSSLGRLVTPQGTTDFVLNFTTPEYETQAAAAWEVKLSGAGRFFLLGVEHILIGYDHLMFLLGLIVASLRLRYLLTVITMFTAAHTVTLLLAALGYVALPGRLVESLIALSIVYIAVENLAGWGLRFRWAVTFGFGLVHGLGFAAVLAGLSDGGETSVASLVAFNLGVEAGQLGVVAVVLPVLLLAARVRLFPWLARAISALILAAGLYWLVVRAFF